MNRAYDHCPHCGAALGDGAWPKSCGDCGAPQFLNPAPVAVALVPIGSGLLTVRRAIQPQQGELALPGGFIDLGESWQQAAVREVREETGLEVTSEGVELFDVASAPDGTLLVFAQVPSIPSHALERAVAGPEVSEILVLDAPRDLAFSLHTEMVRRWFG